MLDFFFPNGFEKGVLNRLRDLLFGDGSDEVVEGGSVAEEGAAFAWREYFPNWLGGGKVELELEVLRGEEVGGGEGKEGVVGEGVGGRPFVLEEAEAEAEKEG